MLAVLVYLGALLIARDVLARDSGRRLFVLTTMALSAVLTLLTALQWDLLFLRWWSLTDWTITPPLGMNVPSEPWGHRHDLAILIAMLYPAWWIGRLSPVRVLLGVVFGLLGLSVIVIGGSRMVWLAIATATVVVAIPFAMRRARLSPSRMLWPSLAAVALVVVVLASGLANPLIERLLGAASLSERTAMWGALAGSFADHPVAGLGPGSFPWILQLTGYFDTNSFSPRHPDSAVIQLAAEAGLLGLAAMAIAVVSIGRRLPRSRSVAATWALVAFGLAALAGNPTDFPFMVIVAIAWLAFALPHDAQTAVVARTRGRPVKAASLTAMGLIGAAMLATIGGQFFYLQARAEIESGDVAAAEAPLKLAAALDPGMALYPRQLGILYVLQSEPDAAVPELQRATSLNRSDDLTWRALSLAYLELGRSNASVAAAERAAELQRGDVTNLLLVARLEQDANQGRDAFAALAEAVQAWPELMAAPEWSSMVDGFTTQDVVGTALGRWTAGAASPEPVGTQPLLLTALSSPPRDVPGAISHVSPSLAAAYVSVMSCSATAGSDLSSVPQADRRGGTYWALEARQAVLDDDDPTVAIQLYSILAGDPLLADGLPKPLNPLAENGVRGSSADRWGYRRPPIHWPDTPWDLPSPRSGFANLVRFPAQAALS